MRHRPPRGGRAGQSGSVSIRCSNVALHNSGRMAICHVEEKPDCETVPLSQRWDPAARQVGWHVPTPVGLRRPEPLSELPDVRLPGRARPLTSPGTSSPVK